MGAKGPPKAVRVDVNYKTKTYFESLEQGRNRTEEEEKRYL